MRPRWALLLPPPTDAAFKDNRGDLLVGEQGAFVSRPAGHGQGQQPIPAAAG